VATGFFTSATGVTIYRGTAYPAEYRGNAFIGDVGGNLVHRKVLTKNGAEFLATRADKNVEFLASTDNWFRPVNFTNTPNGTLLILDMYRETIEHPMSIPEPIKKHLDLTSGRDRGRLYELASDGFKRRPTPALTKAPTAELVETLADPDAWWRETAQRLLIERKDAAAIPLLKKLSQERPNALGRVHALWTLDVLGHLDADDLTLPLLDPDAPVREQAARLAEGLGAKVRLIAWARLAFDPDAMVRFQAALSAGALDRGSALNLLYAIARKDAGDRWTRQAVMSSLHSSEAVVLLYLLAQAGSFLDEAPGNVWLGELSTLVGAGNEPADVRATLSLFTDPGANEGPARLNAVLLGLGRGLQRSGGSLRAALEGPGAEGIAPLFERAAQTVAGDGPVAARLDAIRLLGLGPATGALKALPPLLDARQPTPVQLAALQALANLADPNVGTSLIAHWKALSPSVRREAVEALFARPERITALLDAVEKKVVAVADIDPVRRKLLLGSSNVTVKDRAAKLFAGDPSTDRGRVIASYRKALALDGTREKGRAVFKKVCATCHKAEGEGTDVGPNLATITGRTPEDLLIHILDPNREVPPQYINYSVATADGRVVTGLIAEESANAVTLKRAEGATDVVPRNRIEEIASTGLSLMPEGLEKGLEPQDFADLIAFLRGLQGNGPTTPAR
ncbi:MAG: c-type cytochrome, partial [Isosphaeraceae bacterium]|nr:c-type cytochrome [Isosphaeraceae bacterium]